MNYAICFHFNWCQKFGFLCFNYPFVKVELTWPKRWTHASWIFILHYLNLQHFSIPLISSFNNIFNQMINCHRKLFNQTFKENFFNAAKSEEEETACDAVDSWNWFLTENSHCKLCNDFKALLVVEWNVNLRWQKSSSILHNYLSCTLNETFMTKYRSNEPQELMVYHICIT